MKKYALTGGPGCGKSTVSAILREIANWKIIDADAVCHEISAAPGPELAEQLPARWGNDVIAPDGMVNRRALADAVFSGRSGGIAELNRIVHPVIHQEILRRMEQGGPDDVMVLDAALLYETGWDSIATDGVIAVWTDPEEQHARLKARGWSEEQIAGRIAAQLSADEKLERADWGLINNSTVDALREQCLLLINKIQTKTE